MAKKKENIEKKADIKKSEMYEKLGLNVPKDVQDKVTQLKDKLTEFQEKLLEKFDDYVMGIALIPPQRKMPQFPQRTVQAGIKQEKPDPNKTSVLVLVDDTDSKKMSKLELKSKLSVIIGKMAEQVDKNLDAQTILLTELWQNCYDGKYEILKTIALSSPIYDTGMLAAIKISEVHKTMVLKKFERYIVSYVLAGSLVQGRATKSSDIDVWIVIDDTDVKRMTRAELKDKLRAIIIGMGIEAGEITGIKNKLNIQVYILTDFWDNLKQANPIIFTLLRDGVPFYDRGMFMPWKKLLKMGKIQPSSEAIDKFMRTGEKMLDTVSLKMKRMAMEDCYYAILTPSQAALMLYGLPPPAPSETPELMMETFVKKEKLLDKKDVKILEDNIKIRKDIEHGTKKDVSGEELDKLLTSAETYLEKIRGLFDKIEAIKEKEKMVTLYDRVQTVVRDVLRMEGVEKVKDENLVKKFDSELVDTGKVPAKYLTLLESICAAKKKYDNDKITHSEVAKAEKNTNKLVKHIVEYMQRKRGKELEKAKIRVKHGKQFGEVLLLGKNAFIIHDVDDESKGISKAKIKKDGSLSTVKDSNMDELEEALASVDIPPKVFIKEPIFEDLKDLFGKDVEILVNR